MISWIFAIVIFLLSSCIALVFIYEDEVKGIVIKELNKHLNAEVKIDPENIDLTFVSSFPKCAIEFKNLTMMETWKKKQRDTLAHAGSLSLRFSIKDLFDKKYDIKQISLSDTRCFLKVDKDGRINYEIWKSTADKRTEQDKNDSLRFRLENISLKNIKISYKNKARKFKAECEVPELSFSGDFSEKEYDMRSKGKVLLHSVASDKTTFIRNKTLNADLDFQIAGEKYTIKKADLSLNKMEFDLNGNFVYSDSLKSLSLNYEAKNMDIESVLSLLPEKQKERINDYRSEGEFFAKGKIAFTHSSAMMFNSSFGIKNATIEYVPKNTKLTNVSLSGEIVSEEKKSFLSLSGINAVLNGDQVNGDFYLENFEDPFIDVKAKGAFDLANLYSFWPVDTLQKLEGGLKFEGEMKGKVSDIKQNTFSDKLSINLDVTVDKLRTQFKNDLKEISVESCRVLAAERNIKVENLKLVKGQTDLQLNGTIPGMFNYLLDSKSPLVIKGDLISNNLVMEDLIFSSGSSSSSESEFNIPDNLNLVLDATIGKFTLGKFGANNIRGNFELKNQKAMVSDMKFETMEGEAVVNAFADASGKNLEMTLQTKITRLNVRKMFTQLNNFGQQTLLDKNINGIVTSDINFYGAWDKKLNPDFNSIIATAEFTIERGELNEFKPLEGLARFVDVQELKRIKFSTLTSTLQIKNGTIFIPQTTIKNSVLNIDFSGTHTFNNDVDYHVRLLISELLAKKRKSDDEFGPVENDPDNRRSAYILMTGNIDNLSFKYDRKGMKQKIKEDIKQEKQNLKQIFREEFGMNKDSSRSKPGTKADQRFELEKPGNKTSKKTLEPKKKKEEEDDDF